MNEQQRKAMELALEALTATMSTHGFRDAIDDVHDKAITAIKEALHDENKSLGLYEPEQRSVSEHLEPWSNVGIGVDVTKEGVSVVGIYKLSNDSSHLFYSQFYTTPPQRSEASKPLTDAQINEIAGEYGAGGWICDFARAIEAAHGIRPADLKE